MPEMDDFGDVGAIQQTGDGAVYWDTLLSDLLTELENINVQTARIESATILSDMPLRYRSGTPLYLTQFEHGAGPWVGSSVGADGGSEVSTDIWLSKGKSWILTAGSDSTRYARMDLRLGPYPNGEYSLEAAFTLGDNVIRLRFVVIWIDGSVGIIPTVWLDLEDAKVYIDDENLGYVSVIDPWNPDTDNDAWHFIKFTFDTESLLYTTLFLDEHEVDLSAYEIETASGYSDQAIRVYIQVDSTSGENATCYIDDIALVEEE